MIGMINVRHDIMCHISYLFLQVYDYLYVYSELQNGAVIEGDISPKPSHKQDSQG